MSRETRADSIEGEQKSVKVDTKYEKCQYNIFSFLESPKTIYAMAYHISNQALIFGSMLISVLSTCDYFEKHPQFLKFTFAYENGILVWFTLEYLFRVWSCGVFKRFRGWRGRIRFLKNFYMIVDAFIIVSTLITSLLQVETSYFTLLRATRFLQVLRILRIDRQKGDLAVMFHVVNKHHRELLTCYFAGFIILFGGSYVVYILENSAKDATITDMVSGLYWGFITVTSVGYGDMSPVTSGGKLFSGIFALVGCAFFSLPAGILGSGFAIQVAKQKNEQSLLKVRNPAALLIQAAWRNHATKRKNVQFQGTWDKFLPIITGKQVQWPGYYSCLPGIKAICNSKHFDAFDVNMPISADQLGKNSVITPFHNMVMNLMTNPTPIKKSNHRRKKARCLSIRTGLSRKSTKSTIIPRHQFIPSQRTSKSDKMKQSKYIAATRFIMRIKYWACVKQFRKQRYPFVEIKDISEKNVQWHLEILSFLREVKERTTIQREELRRMKLALHQKVYSEISSVVNRKYIEKKNNGY